MSLIYVHTLHVSYILHESCFIPQCWHCYSGLSLYLLVANFLPQNVQTWCFSETSHISVWNVCKRFATLLALMMVITCTLSTVRIYMAQVFRSVLKCFGTSIAYQVYQVPLYLLYRRNVPVMGSLTEGHIMITIIITIMPNISLSDIFTFFSKCIFFVKKRNANKYIYI